MATIRGHAATGVSGSPGGEKDAAVRARPPIGNAAGALQ